ncbi:MAG: putative glycoside hydrolase [Oscillospiraceae bacterium]|nr:putative glycoside hydrolase [Oscillospiraceae bacterium]
MSRPSNVYRGKRKYNWILSVIAFAMTFVLGIVVFLVFSLQKYIVYDKDGPSLFVPVLEGVDPESMFGQAEEIAKKDSAGLTLPEGVELVVSAPDYSKPKLIAHKNPGEIQGQSLSPPSINAPPLEYFALTDVQALMLDIKPDPGILSYSSSVLLAISYGVNGESIIADQLTALKDRGVYLSARVNVLHDAAMASRNPPLAIRNFNGSDIFSFNGMFYLDPYNESVRAYLEDIMMELSILGFDEVVFSGLSLPNGASISYSGEMTMMPDSVTALASLAFFLRETADTLHIKVGVEIETSALRGSDGLASVGQSLDLYSRIFDRVYFISDAGYLNFDLQTIENHFTDNAPGRIVPILDYALKEGSYIYMPGN